MQHEDAAYARVCIKEGDPFQGRLDRRSFRDTDDIDRDADLRISKRFLDRTKITQAARVITAEQYADLWGANPRVEDASTRLDLSKDLPLDDLCI
jgi:hypothetical protein